jgi:hypothetical protein
MGDGVGHATADAYDTAIEMTRAGGVVLAVALFAGASGCKQSKQTPAPAPTRARATPVPVRPLPEDVVKCVDTEVAAGFATASDIEDGCFDAAEDDAKVVNRRHLAQLVARTLAKHKSEELDWQGLTDCDRLDAAFASMEKEGIVARQNFADCQTCGAAEIEEEADKLTEAGTKVKGYAFYHMQDTEGAVENSGLYLSYGAIGAGGDAAGVKVGHRVLRILKQHGLRAEWNGKIERRIALPDLKWQRRRFTRAPDLGSAAQAERR